LRLPDHGRAETVAAQYFQTFEQAPGKRDAFLPENFPMVLLQRQQEFFGQEPKAV